MIECNGIEIALLAKNGTALEEKNIQDDHNSKYLIISEDADLEFEIDLTLTERFAWMTAQDILVATALDDGIDEYLEGNSRTQAWIVRKQDREIRKCLFHRASTWKNEKASWKQKTYCIPRPVATGR